MQESHGHRFLMRQAVFAIGCVTIDPNNPNRNLGRYPAKIMAEDIFPSVMGCISAKMVGAHGKIWD